MTLIYSQPTPAGVAGLHALVLGVGEYPSAKPGFPGPLLLQNVTDLPSAANSAQLVVDWLIDHAANLAAPLASIELLVSGPPGAGYVAHHPPPGPVDPPTTANVQAAGLGWLQRCRQSPGSVALFFSCGHGAIDGDDTTIFLADLNTDPNLPWSKLNVREAARAFKKEPNIAAAHFFIDACQEFIPQLALSSTGVGARFTGQPDPFEPPGAEKVTLLTAAAPGLLAYEGDISGQQPGVRAGRFTQTVLQALSGAAARDLSGSGDWVVYPGAVFEDLKALYRLRPEWRDLPFDPTTRETPNEIVPIIHCAQPPSIPVLVKTDPAEAIGTLDMSILCGAKTPPPLDACAPSVRTEWAVWLPASQDRHWLVAQSPDGAAFERSFVPSRSLWTQMLKVSS